VTTHWSLVLQAGQSDSKQAAEALEDLCRAYWYPLYAYVRRQGHSPHDAEDLTQGFFKRFLEKEYLRNADQGRGRFRTFLLSSLKHFLINEWRRSNRLKKGGGQLALSLDETATAEQRFIAEPVSAQPPDAQYDRGWAMAVLHRVMGRLQAEYVESGKGELFEDLSDFLTADGDTGSYAEIARRLQMTEGNLKVTIHRLRRRYRELMRKEVATTVEDPGQIDTEIELLISALGN
jgi:RNA polymerase sigma-70 factor (ECF subfamily)